MVKEKELTSCFSFKSNPSICSNEIATSEYSLPGLSNILNSNSWTLEEDNMLMSITSHYGNNSWDQVSRMLHHKKSPAECMIRWKLINQYFIQKGPWTKKEDKLLIEWVNQNGESDWASCSKYISSRSSKQCKVRWKKFLSPLILRSEWRPEEDYIIFKIFKEVGSSWTTIKRYLPGRSDQYSPNHLLFETRFDLAYKQLMFATNHSKNQEDLSSITFDNLLSKRSKSSHNISVESDIMQVDLISRNKEQIRDKRIFLIKKHPPKFAKNVNKYQVESISDSEQQILDLNFNEVGFILNENKNETIRIPDLPDDPQFIIVYSKFKRDNIFGDLFPDYIEDFKSEAEVQKSTVEIPDFISIGFNEANSSLISDFQRSELTPSKKIYLRFDSSSIS